MFFGKKAPVCNKPVIYLLLHPPTPLNRPHTKHIITAARTLEQLQERSTAHETKLELRARQMYERTRDRVQMNDDVGGTTVPVVRVGAAERILVRLRWFAVDFAVAADEHPTNTAQTPAKPVSHPPACCWQDYLYSMAAGVVQGFFRRAAAKKNLQYAHMPTPHRPPTRLHLPARCSLDEADSSPTHAHQLVVRMHYHRFAPPPRRVLHEQRAAVILQRSERGRQTRCVD